MSQGNVREWEMMEQGTMLLVDPDENDGEPMFEAFELSPGTVGSGKGSLSGRREYILSQSSAIID